MAQVKMTLELTVAVTLWLTSDVTVAATAHRQNHAIITGCAVAPAQR